MSSGQSPRRSSRIKSLGDQKGFLQEQSLGRLLAQSPRNSTRRKSLGELKGSPKKHARTTQSPEESSRRRSLDSLKESEQKQARVPKRSQSCPPIKKITRQAVMNHLQKAARDGGFSTFSEADWESCYGGKVKLPHLPDDFNSALHDLPDLDDMLDLEVDTQQLLFSRILEGQIRTKDMLHQGPEKVRYLTIQASVIETFGFLTPSFGKSGFGLLVPEQPLASGVKSLKEQAQGDQNGQRQSEEGPNFASQFLEDEDILNEEETEQLNNRRPVEMQAEPSAEETQPEPSGEEEPPQPSTSGRASSAGGPEVFLVGKEDLKISIEEYLKGNFAKGPVEFVVYEKNSRRLVGIIEVKRALGGLNAKDCFFQLSSQMCALVEINALHKRKKRQSEADTQEQSETEAEEQIWHVWGILTDGDDWIFATLKARVAIVNKKDKEGHIGVLWHDSELKLSRLYQLFNKEEGTRDSGKCICCLGRFLAPHIDKLTTAEIAGLFQQAYERLDKRVALGMDSFSRFHTVSSTAGQGTFAEAMKFWREQKQDEKDQHADLLIAAPTEVDAFLDGIGLGSYKKAFQDHQVQFNMMEELTADDFRRLGVLVGDSVIIRRALKKPPPS